MSVVLETSRLLLRPWEDADAPALFSYASNPHIGLCAGWPPHTSVGNSLEVIRTVLSEPETYALVFKQTNEPVGSVGIKVKNAGNTQMREHEAEIGYWIGEPYWGRGLVPEAVHKLLSRCFEDMGCVGVWCGRFEDNIKSQRVQEKCGFVYHHRDRVRFAALGEVRTVVFSYLSKTSWCGQQLR